MILRRFNNRLCIPCWSLSKLWRCTTRRQFGKQKQTKKANTHHSLHEAHKAPKGIRFIVHEIQDGREEVVHSLHVPCGESDVWESSDKNTINKQTNRGQSWKRCRWWECHWAFAGVVHFLPRSTGGSGLCEQHPSLIQKTTSATIKSSLAWEVARVTRRISNQFGASFPWIWRSTALGLEKWWSTASSGPHILHGVPPEETPAQLLWSQKGKSQAETSTRSLWCLGTHPGGKEKEKKGNLWEKTKKTKQNKNVGQRRTNPKENLLFQPVHIVDTTLLVKVGMPALRRQGHRAGGFFNWWGFLTLLINKNKK